MQTWQIQEAKDRLGEIVDSALRQGSLALSPKYRAV